MLDCFLCDEAGEYKYVRLTAYDNKDDYLIFGGCSYKVGQKDPKGHFKEIGQ